MNRLFKQQAKTDYLFYIELVGKRLYGFRKERNESLETVGKAVGISPRKIRKMEKGLFDFRPSRVYPCLTFLGIMK